MPSVGGYHQARYTYFKRDYVLPMTMISNCYQITKSFPYKTTTTIHTVNIRCTSDICKQMLTVASADYMDTLHLKAHLGV